MSTRQSHQPHAHGTLDARPLAPLAVLVLAGTLAALVRNWEAVAYPILWAEDGQWTGLLMTSTIGDAYLNNRADYLTVVQIAMLHLALGMNRLIFGESILYLPHFASSISFVFFGLFCALADYALRAHLSRTWRFAFLLICLFLPMGNMGPFIFGGIANLGYYFFPLAFLLIIVKFRNENPKTGIWVDLGLLLCVLTNPLVLSIAGPALVAEIALRSFRRRDGWRRETIRAVVSLGLLGLYVLFLTTRMRIIAAKSVPVTADQIIEAVVGRSVLYPFVAGLYTYLTPLIAWVLVALLAGLWVYAVRRLDPRRRVLLLVALAAGAVATLAMVTQRPFYVSRLNGYDRTFPDSYYVAANILFLLATLLSLSALAPSWQRVARLLTLALALVYVPLTTARENFVPATLYAQRLQDARNMLPPDGDDVVLDLPMDPPGWTMAVPAARVRASIE